MRLTLLAVALAACGTTFNRHPATIIPPPGGYVDRAPGPQVVDKRQPHEVLYPDGHACIVESVIGLRYLVPDLVLTVLVGVVVDASTGAWDRLDEDSCPGVIVRN